MPVIGVVDPSHDEVMNNTLGRYPRWYPVQSIINQANEADPKWSQWSYELLKAMLDELIDEAGDPYHVGDNITTTALVGGCPRSKVLERKEDFIATVGSFYAMFRGTMIHRTLEYAARPGSAVEARFHTTVAGVPLTCKPDLITPQGDLYDYKFTENPPTFGYPWRDHTLQVQYNAFIVRHAEKMSQCPDPSQVGFWRENEQRSATLMYLGPKGPKPIVVEKMQPWFDDKGRESKKKQPYMWTDEEVLEGVSGKWLMPGTKEPGLIQRIEAMAEAFDSYPKFPASFAKTFGGQEDWRCPGPPLCHLPECLAKRYPNGMVWEC